MRGGKRPGAGRKKKALTEKLENNIYNKKLEKLAFSSDLRGEDMPEPDIYLSEQTKGMSENIGREVYVKTWQWLKARGCEKYVSSQTIEQYAMCVARWRQAEKAIHTFGFLAKHPTTQLPIASPFIKISQDFLKQSAMLWTQIYQVVKENCTESFNVNEMDPMEIILSTPPRYDV